MINLNQRSFTFKKWWISWNQGSFTFKKWWISWKCALFIKKYLFLKKLNFAYLVKTQTSNMSFYKKNSIFGNNRDPWGKPRAFTWSSVLLSIFILIPRLRWCFLPLMWSLMTSHYLLTYQLKRMTAIFFMMDGIVNLQEVDGVLDNTVADIAIVPTSLSLKAFKVMNNIWRQ